MTTLVEELEQAATAIDCAAEYLGGAKNRDVFAASAARLRQRAAWVRELGRNTDALMAAYPSAESGAYIALYKSLTGPDVRLTLPAGPIPSETAPAAPCCYAAERALGFHSPGCGRGGATAGEAKRPRECGVCGLADCHRPHAGVPCGCVRCCIGTRP